MVFKWLLVENPFSVFLTDDTIRLEGTKPEAEVAIIATTAITIGENFIIFECLFLFFSLEHGNYFCVCGL